MKVEIGGSALKPIKCLKQGIQTKVKSHVTTCMWTCVAMDKKPRRLQLLTQKYTLFPIYHGTEHEF